jgi:hypothetical protein
LKYFADWNLRLTQRLGETAIFEGTLVPIHKIRSGTIEFPFQKWEVFPKIKKTKQLRKGLQVVRRTNDSEGCRMDCGISTLVGTRWKLTTILC